MRAPIYVNKQILLTDGIKLAYGMDRMRDAKSIYDASLDGYGFYLLQRPYFDYLSFVVPLSMGYIVHSAADGPDSLAEELGLVRNMNLAVQEERYGNAGILA